MEGGMKKGKNYHVCGRDESWRVISEKCAAKICTDMRLLLDELKIPETEQVILLRMAANNKMACEDFKNYLSMLINRTNNNILNIKYNE